MGTGGSNMYTGLPPRRRPFGGGYGSPGGKKHRRGHRRRKASPRSSPHRPAHVVPIRRHYQPSYGSYPYIPPLPVYASPAQPQPYSGYMPMYYNNYPTPPYLSPRQPMMMPQQLAQPVMMPQQVPYSQPMPTSRQIPPSIYSPYGHSFSPPAYSTGAAYSGAYAQAHVHPIYNNAVPPSYASPGFANPNFPSSAAFQLSTGQLSTDWTRGGKISPGFLGPPI